MGETGQYGGSDTLRVVLWKRDGRWCACQYEATGAKAGDATDLGIPDASEVAATEEAARQFGVPATAVGLVDPGNVPGGPRA